MDIRTMSSVFEIALIINHLFQGSIVMTGPIEGPRHYIFAIIFQPSRCVLQGLPRLREKPVS
jgi:hypothetical protein